MVRHRKVAKARKTGIAEFLQYLRSEDYKENLQNTRSPRRLQQSIRVLVQMLDSSGNQQFDYFGKSLMYYAVNCGSLKTVDYLWKRGRAPQCRRRIRPVRPPDAIYNEDLPLIEYF